MSAEKETQEVFLAHFSTEQRRGAMGRFEVIRSHLENSISASQVATQHGIPLRTVQRWLLLYRTHGLVGLVRRVRKDHGAHRQFTSEQKTVLEGLALQKPPPSVAHVHREFTTIAIRQGWPVPNYRSVHRVVSNLAPALVSMAHDGPKKYGETFDLVQRREATTSNQIWQADHCQLDIYLSNDQNLPERPWLTVILDDHSRAIAGFGVSFRAPSILQTSLVLRQAIWRKLSPLWHVCGIPEMFYTDHGSDFTSQHLQQVGADLKMELVFSQVGVPRGRGKIERFFRTVNQLFLCRLPGYAPPGSGPKEAQLTLSIFERQLEQFLLSEYHQRVHGETGLAPQARWEVGGFLPRLPESLEQLDLLLLTVAKTRQVRQDGIHFHNFRYLDSTLAAFVGESVMIRYDPRDMGELRVFHQNRFLCRAICPELAAESVPLREILRARHARRRELRQTLEERAKVVETLLKAHGGYQESLDPPPHTELVTSTVNDLSDKTPKLKRYQNE